MSKFGHYRKLVRVAAAIGGGACGGALLFHYFSDRTGPFSEVHASWTTGFTPSVTWDHNWDKRSPETLTKPPKDGNVESEAYKSKLKEMVPTASRHIFLIRHGQYFEDGETDDKRLLTHLGREQADLCGKRLKELDHPYTALIRSSMTRAMETSDIISKHLPGVPKETSDLLREGAPIPPEPPVGHWRPELHFHTDGARIESAFRSYVHRAPPSQEKDSYEVLVCHGNVIRYFVCRALQFPPEAWLRMALHHASITWITIRPSGRVSLLLLGDSGHLPSKKMTLR